MKWYIATLVRWSLVLECRVAIAQYEDGSNKKVSLSNRFDSVTTVTQHISQGGLSWRLGACISEARIPDAGNR